MGWLYLMLGGAFEVGFTTTMRGVDRFRNLPMTAGFLVCVCLSMLFLGLAQRSIPMGTAYAIWTGIGAIGTVAIGMIWFGEPASVVRVALIAGIIGCVIGLKVSSGE